MELENRKLILRTFTENPGTSGRKIAKLLKLPQTTVASVIKRYKESLTIIKTPGAGRKPGCHNKELKAKVMRSLKNNPSLSDNDRALKFKSTRGIVRRIRVRAGYKSYRAIKYPNRSDKQSLVVKKRSRLLYTNVLTKFKGCILMDDETYVKLDLKQLPGQKFYVSTIRGRVADKFKYVMVDKFAKKTMIWQAICSCGLKTPAFVTSSTMTSEVYVKECLQKRILPFIKKHNAPVMFWPDLASCHYSKKTMEWYQANKVAVMPKIMNPPNCPQFRPIEKYWAIVKRMLKKNGGVVQNVEEMHRKWNYFAGKVTLEGVQRLMGSINKHVRKFLRSNEI